MWCRGKEEVEVGEGLWRDLAPDQSGASSRQLEACRLHGLRRAPTLVSESFRLVLPAPTCCKPVPSNKSQRCVSPTVSAPLTGTLTDAPSIVETMYMCHFLLNIPPHFSTLQQSSVWTAKYSFLLIHHNFFRQSPLARYFGYF